MIAHHQKVQFLRKNYLCLTNARTAVLARSARSSSQNRVQAAAVNLTRRRLTEAAACPPPPRRAAISAGKGEKLEALHAFALAKPERHQCWPLALHILAPHTAAASAVASLSLYPTISLSVAVLTNQYNSIEATARMFARY